MQVTESKTLVYIGNFGGSFVDQKRLARNRKKMTEVRLLQTSVEIFIW